MATIIEIVKQHLRDGGFDGLVCGAAECGCRLDDLHPCGESMSECEPAYSHDDPDSPGDWIMRTSKPSAANPKADSGSEE